MSIRSFDVFDTLLARRYITSDTVIRNVEAITGIAGLFDKRVAADTGSRSLLQIYEELENQKVIPFGEAAKFEALEVQLEAMHSYGIKENLLKVRHGDLLISDMYMRAPDILKLVRSVGMNKQVSIYQSNSGKSSGEFWKNLKGNLDLEYHLGDNIKSDVNNAKDHGHPAEHYPHSGVITQPENTLLNENLRSLAMMIREIRLSNYEPEYPVLFDAANQLNLPWLFFTSEILKRAHGTNKLVFLGRDCQLLQKIYDRFFVPHSYYLPFSRKVALSDPKTAIRYLKNQINPGCLLVDISSTGRTWEKLGEFGFNMNVLVLIHSDVHRYSKEIPVLPEFFRALTKNSQIGQTNEILEIFNCGDHGMLESISFASGIVPLLKFGEHEMPKELVTVLHKPVNNAIELIQKNHYLEIKGELSSLTDEQLFSIWHRYLISICAIEKNHFNIPGYFEKERQYTKTVDS